MEKSPFKDKKETSNADICLLCGKPKGKSRFGTVCESCSVKFAPQTKKYTGLLD